MINLFKNVKIIIGVITILAIGIFTIIINYNLSRIQYTPEFKKVITQQYSIDDIEISILNPLKESIFSISNTTDKLLIIDIIQNAKVSKDTNNQANTYYYFLISNKSNKKSLTIYLSENQIIINNEKYKTNKNIFKKVDKIFKKYYTKNK